MRIRIGAFLFNTDPDPAPHQIYNTKVKSMLRILEKIHVGSVTGSGEGFEINCKVDPDRQHWSIDSPGPHFEPPGFHRDRSRPSTALI
jgi:hypothetical protein